MKYDVRIRVGNNDLSFGKGVVDLLEGIKEYGSLSTAYKHMNMSSSKAWKILNHAQEDLGFSLVETKTDGKNGGNTVLTSQGQKLLGDYKAMSEEIKTYSETIFNKYFEKF